MHVDAAVFIAPCTLSCRYLNHQFILLMSKAKHIATPRRSWAAGRFHSALPLALQVLANEVLP